MVYLTFSIEMPDDTLHGHPMGYMGYGVPHAFPNHFSITEWYRWYEHAGVSLVWCVMCEAVHASTRQG